MNSLMTLKHEVDLLVNWIKHEVFQVNKKGCVVEISGEIDSATVTCLCKLAFPDTTYGIIMPLKSDNLYSVKRAEELCDKFNIDLKLDEIDIFSCQQPSKRCLENYYARQRMAKLYIWAEYFDCLVVGAKNKSENFIGHFTKYGNGGVDLEPINQYFKSEIYEFAKYLGVVDSIINIASVELSNMKYDDLEKAIRDIETAQAKPSNNGWLSDINELSQKNEIIEKVWKMHVVTEHKRMIPKEYNR